MSSFPFQLILIVIDIAHNKCLLRFANQNFMKLTSPGLRF